MFLKDISICCQLFADTLKKKEANKCYIKPACGCLNPGKELKCENCEYLESCLSRCQRKGSI